MVADIASAGHEPVFSLGRIKFCIRNCDPKYAQRLTEVLPTVSPGDLSDGQKIVSINMGCEKDLGGLVNHVVRLHKRQLWLKSACLLSPSGRSLLIAGGTDSGKTTLALLLCLKHGYKLVSEDFCLVDSENRQILSFAAPLFIKEGSDQLLQEFGVCLPASSFEYYASLTGLSAGKNISLPVQFAFMLTSPNIGPFEPVRPMTHSEFVRKMLPLSNALVAADGMERVSAVLDSCDLTLLACADLNERLALVLARTAAD